MAKLLTSTLVLFLLTHISFGQLRSKKVVDTVYNFKYLEYTQKTTKANPPILIHLHGKRGRDNGTEEGLRKMENNSPIRYLVESNNSSRKYPFVILAPQLPAKTASWEPELIDDFVNYAIKKYNADQSKIYLSGISLGGNGVWKYAYSAFNSPNKLAAIAPIAAWGNSKKACAVKKRNIPTWAFHGKEDQTVDFERGLGMFNALKNCGSSLDSKNYKFTEYSNTKHNSWSRAYLPAADSSRRQDVYQWFLAHTLQKDAAHEKKAKSDATLEAGELQFIQKLPPSLKESSGMEVGPNNSLWVHNDSGNGPFLLNYDTAKRTSFLKKITYASNVDWEDITKDKEGNFYVGDIGNNDNLRKELYIYKISPPDTSSGRQSAETISFYYEDQLEFPPTVEEMNFDAEALIHWNDFLYIFSKNRTEPFTGYSKIYKIPSIPGKHKAILYDSIYIGEGSIIDNQVTGAALSPDEKNLVLLTYSKVLLVSCFSNGQFSSGKQTSISLNNLSQKEAICFINDSEVLITDELFRNILGGNLYKLDLSNWLAEACK